MNAGAMFVRCMQHQQGETEPISTARGNEQGDSSVVLSASDTGFEGHAGQRAAVADHRDDGSEIP